jgi:hypothetical protein
MRELPILFSTDMVRAILDGIKTQTRRIIKSHIVDRFVLDSSGKLLGSYKEGDVDSYPTIDDAPYQPGDILYVRETWRCVKYDSTDGDLSYGVEFKDGTRKYFEFDDNERFHQFGKFAFKDGWQPSMFMPKEAARIWLEVTDVRVERLQEITEKDAIKEGVRVGIGGMPYFSCQDAFPALWDSTIKNQDLPLYGWDSNCWVWIYEFKRLEGRA